MIVVPGIGNSGPEHWQTLWQQPADVRIAPASWTEPVLDDWLDAFDRCVVASPRDVVVAHSLGCLAVSAWLLESGGEVSAVMFVAPPDPTGPAFPRDASGFHEVVAGPSGVPSVVVASTDDPYASTSYAREYAAASGARYVEVGARGHLNTASGLGDWPEGQQILDQLRETR